MAFQQPRPAPRQTQHTAPQSIETTFVRPAARREDSFASTEWILFSPSQAGESSTNQTTTTRTAGLSRASDLGSLNTAARLGRLESEVLEEEATEDGELDALDDGLHAFRETPLYQATSIQNVGTVLPTHDGLGTFGASSSAVQEQLWQHEQYNPKRKYEGTHRRMSSVQRRLDTIEEFDAQVNEDKRLRIEKWRMEQSQALLDEVERETRRRLRRGSTREREPTAMSIAVVEDMLGTTPKQSDYLPYHQDPEVEESEPFWRRITRKFIRDVIGIDEPLLSVILGESLPEEAINPPILPTIPEQVNIGAPADPANGTWRDRLLRRIAKELGVLVHQLSPHPGAFNTYVSTSNQDYAGIPINSKSISSTRRPSLVHNISSDSQLPIDSAAGPTFNPTVPVEPSHAASWGIEEDASPSLSSTAQLRDAERLRQEREYWEKALSVETVFRFLKDRFAGRTPELDMWGPSFPEASQDAARRAAIIRQHHPLVARAHRSPARLKREARLQHVRRASSSCASESVKSSRKLSGSNSAHYWDIGGSAHSGSMLASGGMMGAWGEV
jgi:hypothetical protein